MRAVVVLQLQLWSARAQRTECREALAGGDGAARMLQASAPQSSDRIIDARSVESLTDGGGKESRCIASALLEPGLAGCIFGTKGTRTRDRVAEGTPGWGPLSYSAVRSINRPSAPIKGVVLEQPPPTAIYMSGGICDPKMGRMRPFVMGVKSPPFTGKGRAIPFSRFPARSRAYCSHCALLADGVGHCTLTVTP